MSSSLSTTRKSVFALHIRPLKGALTLKARKLQTALARVAGEQYKRLPETERERIEDAVRAHVRELRQGRHSDVPTILLQPRFTTKLRDVAEMVGHDPADARHMMDDLQRLVTTQVEFNVLGHLASEKEADLYPWELQVHTSLASSILRAGRGLISWGYDPLIFMVMVNPRTYTYLSQELIRNARTYTALALYENVRKYVGVHKTRALPVRAWQELLSEDGKVPAWEDSAELKRKLRHAMAELRACEGCDIDIECKEVHIPGAGKGLEFHVALRAQSQLLFGEPIPENRELAAALEKEFNLSRAEVRHYIEEFGEEYLYGKLTLYKRSAATQTIRNPGGWFNSAVQQDWEDREVKEDKARADRARQAQQEQAFAQAQAEFQQMRGDTIRAILVGLSDEERASWQQRFVETPEGQRAQGTLKPGSKGFEASFVRWLGEHAGWLTEEHQKDLARYIFWRSQNPTAATATA